MLVSFTIFRTAVERNVIPLVVVDLCIEGGGAIVLKMLAIGRLYERGVKTYDFMGLAEPYKLRWPDRQ